MDDYMEQVVREKIYKYVRQIKDATKIGHALKRLESIPMTLDRLSETGVGKAVNSLRNNAEHGSYALRIVEQWKSIARREGLEEKTVKREPADSPQPVKQEAAEEELYTYGSDDEEQREEEEEANGYSYSYEVDEEEEQRADPDRYSPAPMSHHQEVKYEPREASESPPPVSNGKHRVKERRRSPSPPPKVKREPVEDRSSESHPKKKAKRMLEASRSPPVEQDSRWKHKVKAEPSDSPPDGLRKRKIVKSEQAQDLDPFAAALLAAEKLPPSKPKKLKPSTSAGGSSSSSYRSDPFVESPESVIEALGRSVQSVPIARGSSSSDVTEVKSHAAGRRTGRTKMFAGRKKTFSGEVPSLFQMCVRVCQDNLDMIQETWPLGFDILRPILEKCNETQLARIEQRNEYLEEDTDCLWERHVQRVFPRSEKLPYESWKECFNRFVEEREERLKHLSKKISKHAQEQAAPQRKALMADPIAPRNARKAQIRNGIVVSSARVPTAAELSKSRRQIFETGNTADLRDLPLALRHTTSKVGGSSRSGSSAPPPKPGAVKKGALMAKTLKMLGKKRNK